MALSPLSMFISLIPLSALTGFFVLSVWFVIAVLRYTKSKRPISWLRLRANCTTAVTPPRPNSKLCARSSGQRMGCRLSGRQAIRLGSDVDFVLSSGIGRTNWTGPSCTRELAAHDWSSRIGTGRTVMSRALVLLTVPLLLVTTAAQAQLGFAVETSPYFLPQPPYAEGQRITGQFVLDGPLPNWQVDLDLRDRLVSFEFDDGVETRTPADSEVCAFVATVDARGRLIDWNLDVRQRPVPQPGQPQHALRLTPRFSQAGFRTSGDTVCSEGNFDLVALGLNTILTPDVTPPPVASATYRYASAPFLAAQSPYSVGDSFVASLGFAGPLPPLRSDFDLAPFVEQAIVQDPVNGTLGSLTVCDFRASTDESGAIVDWSMVLTKFLPVPAIYPPPPSARVPGWSTAPERDAVLSGIGSTCLDSEVVASSAGGGSWSGGAPVAVPGLRSPIVLALLAGLLLILGGIALRS